jgi:hypothetical protein
MKGYEHRREQHTAFALKQSGQIPEASAGFPLGVSNSCAFTALRLLLCALLIFSIPGAQAGDTTEWSLSQKQSELGAYKVFFIKGAVKVINTTLGYEVTAKAPTWKVVIYRPLEKTGYELEMFPFIHFQIFGFINEPRKAGKRPLLKVGTEEVNGLKITKYRTPNGLEDSWVTDSIDVLPNVIDVIETCYRLRHSPGIPLCVVSNAKTGVGPEIPISSWMSGGINLGRHDRLVQLRTYSWKIVPFHASDFDYPTGYKRVKDPRDLVFSSAKKNSMEDVVRDMGIGEKLGSPSK